MLCQYTPLQQGDIRLFKPLPGQSNQPIHAELSSERLDGTLSYEALSYC